MAVRETIMVVAEEGKEKFTALINDFGCNVIRVESQNAVRTMKRFVRDYTQGIPVAVVQGCSPDQASIIAMQLKAVCASTRVIAISDVKAPSRDEGRDYDVIIPRIETDLRDMLNMFLSCREF